MRRPASFSSGCATSAMDGSDGVCTIAARSRRGRQAQRRRTRRIDHRLQRGRGQLVALLALGAATCGAQVCQPVPPAPAGRPPAGPCPRPGCPSARGADDHCVSSSIPVLMQTPDLNSRAHDRPPADGWGPLPIHANAAGRDIMGGPPPRGAATVPDPVRPARLGGQDCSNGARRLRVVLSCGCLVADISLDEHDSSLPELTNECCCQDLLHRR